MRRVEDVARVPVVENGDLAMEGNNRMCGNNRIIELTNNRMGGDGRMGGEGNGLDGGASDAAQDRGGTRERMVGRAFVRHLGAREDIGELLGRYIDASVAELHGERPVLGRMKELIGYWKELPNWRRRWEVVKICRTVGELRAIIW